MATAGGVVAPASMAIADSDEDIIQELVSHQQVPNMSKLQFLLRSICSRLALQALRIEKAEEQGRNTAFLKDEFDQLSKTVIDDLKAQKEVEDKLKGLDDMAKQYVDVVAGLQGADISGLQGADLSILQSLPSRLSAIEERIQGLKNGDERSLSQGDQQAGLLPTERMEILKDVDSQNDRIKKIEEQIKELKLIFQDTAKAHSSDIVSLQKICRNLRSDIEMLPILEMSASAETSPVLDDTDVGQALTEIRSQLQRKADRDIVDQLVRATAQAKEGIDKMKAVFDDLKQQVRALVLPTSQRAALSQDRQYIQADIGAASLADTQNEHDMGVALMSDAQNVHPQNVRMGMICDERGQSDMTKNEGEQIDTTKNEGVQVETAKNASEQGDMTRNESLQIDTGAQIEIACIPEIEVTSNSRRSSIGDSLMQKVRNIVDGRIKSLEGEIVTLATQLAGKADRKDVDGLQIQISLLGHQPSHNLVSLAAYKCDGVLMETASEVESRKNQSNLESKEVWEDKKENPVSISGSESQSVKSDNIAIQIALQRLQELVSKKADRDELHVLHEAVRRQREQPHLSVSESVDTEALQQMHKSMLHAMDDLKDKMEKLEERSDLNILISKRLQNSLQPAATIQESQNLDEVQVAINEHAIRMMEYADTLLQMEALLATKADAAGLQALRASILELKKRNKCISRENKSSSIDVGMNQEELPAGVVLAAEKIEKHEAMLVKLLRDMELLGTGVLTLSGHSHMNGLEGPQGQENLLLHAEPMEMKAGSLDMDRKGSDGAFENAAHVKANAEEPDRHELESDTGMRKNAQTLMESSVIDKDTLHELEEALQEKLIKPKGDADVVNKLAEDMLPLSMKLKELNETIRSLQDNTAEKDELQKMKNYMKQRLDRAETAMFSGKGLPGFKCMSCAHRLEKLNPNRAEFLPTNCMPRQLLPMHTAERLFNKEGECDSPRIPMRSSSPTFENQNKVVPNTNSRQLLSPTPNEAQFVGPPGKPAKKK